MNIIKIEKNIDKEVFNFKKNKKKDKNNYYLFFPLFPLPTSSLFYNYRIQRNTKDEINDEQYVPENIKKTFTTSIIDTNIYINYVNIVCTPR